MSVASTILGDIQRKFSRKEKLIMASTIIEDIRKAQQERYDREDKSLLDALNQANAYLSAQYNLDEEVK